jgi:FkbM family methyltransferase
VGLVLSAEHRADPDPGGLRGIVRRSARRAGLEPGLLHAYAAALKAVESPTVRRNRRDDERVRLLAAVVLRSDSSCVDIGANEGRLLEVFAELAPNGRHIAYEPVPHLRASLARRFPHVDVRGVAVSDRCGESTFVVNTRLPSRSSLRNLGFDRAHTETITVPLETLDAGLPTDFVPQLLKVDVEGAEQLVLNGGRETLRKYGPIVLFEHQRGTASQYGTGPDEIMDLLVADLGMRIFDMDGGGPYSRSQFRDAYGSGSRWNFFAVPARSS